MRSQKYLKYTIEDWKSHIGEKHNRLTIIDVIPPSITGGNTFYHCLCDCGNTADISASSVLNDRTKSCGCLHKESMKKMMTTHGLTNTRLFRIHNAMKNRCYNPNTNNYERYGAKGITICDEWKNDFKAFYDWAISNGYRDDLTIDRIDSTKGYEPSNCRWTSYKEQGRNRSATHYIEYMGQSKYIKEWAEYFGFNYKYFHEKLKDNNYSLETTLELPYFKEKMRCCQ